MKVAMCVYVSHERLVWKYITHAALLPAMSGHYRKELAHRALHHIIQCLLTFSMYLAEYYATLHCVVFTAVWLSNIHCCMDTKSLLCQIQLHVVFKLNHDSLGPEQNAGDAINRDVERAVMAVGGCSFPLSFPAQVVADNLNWPHKR